MFGNAGRNSLRGPGLFTADWGLDKNFHLTERTTLQFRWEVFNVLNRVKSRKSEGRCGRSSGRANYRHLGWSANAQSAVWTGFDILDFRTSGLRRKMLNNAVPWFGLKPGALLETDVESGESDSRVPNLQFRLPQTRWGGSHREIIGSRTIPLPITLRHLHPEPFLQ
jgi:hypothetical protein